MQYTSNELSEYWKLNGTADVSFLYQYNRRGVKETLLRMQSSTGVVVEGHLLRIFREQGFDIDVDRDNKSVYVPTQLFDSLAKYVKPTLSHDEAVLKHAISLAFKTFGRRDGQDKLPVLEFDYELRSAVKMDKASGAPHFCKKSDAFEADLRLAQRLVDAKRAVPPCVAYHRVQHGPEGPKTRLVWGYPLSMTLIEARFARPLIERYLEMRTPMTFGLLKHQVGGRVLELQRGGVTYSLDFSKFDASIPNRLIYAAFDVLKTHFDLTPDQERAWKLAVNYFIHTPILMPDGGVYQKHTGVPSGSYFTQLIDSIANYIIIQYVAMCVAGQAVSDRQINVLGDDSLFTLSEWVTVEDLAAAAADLNVTVNVLKSDRYRLNEAPSFLGHDWHAGVPDRPVNELVKRIVFPERPSVREFGRENHRQREIGRLMAYVSDAASAWNLVYSTGHLGYSTNLTAFHALYRRDRYPLTGWMEHSSLYNHDPPTAAKLMLYGLIK